MKAILSLEEFEARHYERDAVLMSYIASARGRRIMDEDVKRRLLHSSAMSLLATNGTARIAVARAAFATFRALATAVKKRDRNDVYFFTVASREMAFDREAANSFDHQEAIARFRKHLGPGDYLGIVEAAYYSNMKLLGRTTGPTISWHFHVLDWGRTRASAEGALAELTAIGATLIPGRKMAHARHLTPGRMVGRAMYMLKAPMSEYRIYPRKYELIDDETGEISTAPDGSFVSKKRELRPGDSLQLCSVMGDRTIPDLMFSSGEGDRAMSLILQRARRSIRVLDRAHVAELRELTGLNA